MITMDKFLDVDFKKSTMCNNDPVCVEVARKNGKVAVRDSKDPKKQMLTFDNTEWKAFVEGVKKCEFDI